MSKTTSSFSLVVWIRLSHPSLEREAGTVNGLFNKRLPPGRWRLWGGCPSKEVWETLR